MSAKISVIIKQPGRVPYKTAISPTLKNCSRRWAATSRP